MDTKVNKRPLLLDTDSEDCDSQNEVLERNLEPSFFNADQKPLFRPHEPSDKYYMCYMIFYLIGIATLVPWNFFITADDYWMYKFRDVSGNVTKVSAVPGGRSPLQKEFTSYLSIASAVPNTIFLILCTFINQRVPLQIRMIGSLLVMIVFFVLTTVLVNVNTDRWQDGFFILTMVSVIILNVACAILSGSVFGIVGKFSPSYISAVVSGQALGGIFTALVQIFSLATGESSTHSAFMYFMIGNVVIVVTLVLYVILSKSVFFQYHLQVKVEDDSGTATIQSERSARHYSYWDIFKKIRIYGVSEWMVFVVTLSIFPGVTVLIESENKGSGSQWSDLYFVPVVSYLIFNTGDYLGRLMAGYFQWPKDKGLLVLALNFTRLAFVPLLLLCNAQPRHHLPVLIRGDIYYILIITLFAISNGYLANIAVIIAPRYKIIKAAVLVLFANFTLRNVDHHEKEIASSMMAAFLGVGLSMGSVLSLLMVKLL